MKQYKDKETELKNKELTLKPRSGVAKILALMEDFDQDDEWGIDISFVILYKLLLANRNFIIWNY